MMLSDDVLSRLSQLNRGHLPVESPAESASTNTDEITFLHGSLSESEDVSQLPAGQEVENAWGRHWVRERPLAQIWPHGEQWLSREMVRWDESRHRSAPLASELRALLEAVPDRVIYLDLETCGFAGSMIFLVGLIHQQNEDLVLSQLLARDYSEEKAMLQTLWTIAADKRVLATFNGKSFDWPMVQDRSTVHHLGYGRSHRNTNDGPVPIQQRHPPVLGRDDPRPEPVHCDLLHHARRRWKKTLPDCKLQTLERYILRRQREEDIPGQEIPAAYHDFVRNGDAWLIRSVLHHNALDLITLLQLSMRMFQ